MDPDVVHYKLIAETLDGDRAGAIAKFVDITLEDNGTLPSRATEQLGEDEWREFGTAVWASEAFSEALRMELVDDLNEGEFCGTARWEERQAVVECTTEGLTRRTALHEIAHLVADRSFDDGHRWGWAREFVRLLRTWIGAQAADDWENAWLDALDRANDDPSWARRKPPT